MAEHLNNAFSDKVKKLRDKVQNVTETVAPEERIRELPPSGATISEVIKLVEYAVFDQLMEHFVSNNLIHNNRQGFVPNHNTVTALAQLHDIWLETSKNKDMTAALLLDLSAAFDLIPHSKETGSLQL